MTCVALIIAAFISLPCHAGERPGIYRLDYRHRPGRDEFDDSVILGGVEYKSAAALAAAVAGLPSGSRISWLSGCIEFKEIPVGPAPRMSVVAFKALCEGHGIRFDYRYGARDRLKTKVFQVSPALAARHVDAREWLKSQGVTFPQGTAARWQQATHTLAVINTEENLELIEILVKSGESE